MKEIKNVGFVGIGNMGSLMARHLLSAGFDVIVADNDKLALKSFLSESDAIEANSLEELARKSSVIITMLPNSDVVREVVMGDPTGSDCLLRGFQPGAVFVDCSTSEPWQTRNIGRELEKRGVKMIDAPVSGGRLFAFNGTLDIVVGGDQSTIEFCKPVFEAFSKDIFHCGDLGAGHAMKALNNFVNASVLISLVEALSVGQRFGLETEKMISSMIAATTGRNNPLEKKIVPNILTRRFDSGMDLGLLAKDTRIASDMAEKIGAYAPIAHLCSELWTAASEEIGKAEDQTCVAKLWEQRNETILKFNH